MNKIFFSYSWKDLPIAVRIYADLVRNGLTIWRDEFSAETGKRYADEIRDAMLQCDGVIFMDSSNSRRSQYVRDEWAVLTNSNDWKNGKKKLAVCLINDRAATVKEPELFEGHNGYKFIDFSNCKQLYDNDRSYLNGIKETCKTFGITYNTLYDETDGEDFVDELAKYDLKDIDRTILLREYELIQFRIDNGFPNSVQRLQYFAQECDSMKLACPTPMLQLGIELLKTDKLYEAKHVLNIYTKLYPDDPRGWRALASTCYDLEELDEALLAYNKTLFLSFRIRNNKLQNGNTFIRFNNKRTLDYVFVARLNKAATLYRQGKYNKAIRAFEMAFAESEAQKHALPEHYIDVIDCCSIDELKHHQAHWIDRGLEKFPGDYDLLLSKARWLVMNNCRQDAIKYYERLRKDIPDINVFAEYLPLLDPQIDPAKFNYVYKQAISLNPVSDKEKYKFGFIHYVAGNYIEARKYFEESNYKDHPWYGLLWSL